MPNGTQKLVAPEHGAAEARAGCHRGRQSGERRRSDALVHATLSSSKQAECKNTQQGAKTCFAYNIPSFWMVKLSKKSVSEISIFELPRVENCISRLCPSPLGSHPPKTQIG